MFRRLMRLLRKPNTCRGCGPDADIGPCSKLSALCPVERPLEPPEVVTVFSPERRRVAASQTLGYRMNLLYQAQLRLREGGWDDLADEVDQLHSELWFWNVGCKYPPESLCLFRPERPKE